jgi:outer membrane protein TolC
VAAFDGGSGAAAVDAARGRYAEALAALRQTLRDTVRDVEFALIQAGAAAEAEDSARATVAAAIDLFRASEAAQRSGRLSLFDLEIARSALLSAQTGLISAQRDRARAWVALIKAAGNPSGQLADSGPAPTQGGLP